MRKPYFVRPLAWCVPAGLFPMYELTAYAQDVEEVAAPAVNSGDTAWLLTSTALVMMMTAPGLALFYGGLVNQRNVLSTLMHSFFMLCLISVQWVLGIHAVIWQR